MRNQRTGQRGTNPHKLKQFADIVYGLSQQKRSTFETVVLIDALILDQSVCFTVGLSDILRGGEASSCLQAAATVNNSGCKFSGNINKGLEVIAPVISIRSR